MPNKSVTQKNQSNSLVHGNHSTNRFSFGNSGLSSQLNVSQPFRANSGLSSDAGVRTGIKIGAANNRFEQEADRVSAKVGAMSTSDFATPAIHSKVVPTQRSHIANGLNSCGGNQLSTQSRQYMEPRFGADFSGVTIHKGAAAQQTASELNAKAFTYGSHIWLGKGASEHDNHLMAHELTHVVQQSSINADGLVESGEDLDLRVDGGAIATSLANNRTASLVQNNAPSLQVQRVQTWPEPTSISVTANHQLPIAASHVARGWRSGFGGVSEIKVGYDNPDNPQSVDYTGAKIKENFVRSSGTASFGGCSNSHGQGGASGSTFTVGNAASISRNGLNVNLPAKSNTFYDMHLKGFGTNILPAGVNSQTSLCVQEYTYDGNVIASAEFERHHNVTRATVSGQDVATIDLNKFGTSVVSP